MHVIAKKPSRSPLQTSGAIHKAIVVKLSFGDVVLGPDRHWAEWTGMGIRDTLVIHGHIEKTRSAKGYARRLDLFQVAAEGLFSLIEAEHRLERWWSRNALRRMLDERIVHAMTNRSFEGLVQNPPLTYAVEFLQFGFEFRHVRGGPLLHNRDVKPAKLCHVKQRPCALKQSRNRRAWQVDAQRGPQL
jgi:hypothetical protein